jgi:ADP-heptose:LPS heptosyltransferase
MKILIVRFSSIGDIVLTTPVVRCLKKQLGAELHFVTKKQFATVLASNPYVDKIWQLEGSLSGLLANLKAERFDCLIDLHHNLRSWRIKRALRVKSYSFNKINIQKWLIVNFKINILPKKHIVDRYMETVAHLGVVNDGEGLDHFVPKDFQYTPAQFVEEFGRDVLSRPYVAFVIGAAHATKRVPLEKAVSICRKINLPVLLLGGPDEREMGERVAREAGAHVINTCGKLKLHESAWLVRLAFKVVTHDTGLMHIAAAFKKDTISIWGNTIPEFGMTPYYGSGPDRNITLEVKGLACRPCSKIGYDACPKGHFNCMKQIQEDGFERLHEST